MVQFSLDQQTWHAPMTFLVDPDEAPSDPQYRVITRDDPLAMVAHTAKPGAVRCVRDYWVRFVDIQYGPSKSRRKLNAYLKEQVKDRQIRYLVHFTHVDNLPSIMQLGLLPRDMLIKQNIPYVPLDPIRYDGVSGTCLSIMLPNSSMLYAKAGAYGRHCWAFILVSPAVLWKNDCAFFAHNAACAVYRDVDLSTLKTSAAWDRMFADPRGATRQAMGLPSWFPTDVQAEVKAYDPISPSDFLDVVDINHPAYNYFLCRRNYVC